MPEASTATAGEGTEGAEQQGGQQEQQQGKTFTQADVDKLIRERVNRVKAQFADYDDLKKTAEGSKTVEDRLSAAEQRAAQAEARALRNEIATQFGVSAEDRDLFLTGTDQETLTAQAKRLAERESEQKKQGNVARSEGGNPSGGKKSDVREFTRSLFGNTDT